MAKSKPAIHHHPKTSSGTIKMLQAATALAPYAPFLATLQFDGPHDEAACLIRTNQSTGKMEAILLQKPDDTMMAWITTTNITPQANTIWTHKKRGTKYAVIGLTDLVIDRETHNMVVYSDIETGRPWIRRHNEFLDGRFVKSRIEPTENSSNETIERAINELVDALHNFEKSDERRAPIGLFAYGTDEHPLSTVRDHEAEDVQRQQVNLYSGPDEALARIIYSKALIARKLRRCGAQTILSTIFYNYMTENISPPEELPFARFEELFSEDMTEQQIRTITNELKIDWQTDSTDIDDESDGPLTLHDALAIEQPSWTKSGGWTLSSIWETDEGSMIRRYIRPLTPTNS